MANADLSAAKNAKNDEFYTQYEDIQKEVNAYLEYNPNVFKGKTVLLPCDDPEWSNFTRFFAQNFENFGLKKLISTSFAANSKPADIPYQLTIFETESPMYDVKKTRAKGKIFKLTRDKNKSGRIDINDLEWHYLKGDGDFRSDEIKALRDEADIIVTNPPFSLFREFLAWIMEAGKQFLIIGNMNAITYKEVFPLIKNNQMWLGESIHSGDREFRVPENYPLLAAGSRVDEKGNKYIRVKGVRWFTNLEHGRRHQPLQLMTMADNIKFSKHKDIREHGYLHYDNYDAIEVPYTDAIPSDYVEDMGVPITYLDKHNPDEFEIVKFRKGNDDKDLVYSLPVCSRFVNVERERERREANGAAVLQNHQAQEDVTVSWEYPSVSSTSITPHSLKLSDSTDMCRTTQDSGTDLQSMVAKPTQEFLSNTNSNGVMGVPISFLDKYCPEQFEIVGATESEGRGFSNGLWNSNSGVTQPMLNGTRCYKRIFIRRRKIQE
ncbi:MAG: adenine-specific methyltransferase EcoRI family protein [Clostridiales bacterium]|nr:adenine-specific methyltransferase EcoRI family protein [Clostridiales bacterium]